MSTATPTIFFSDPLNPLRRKVTRKRKVNKFPFNYVFNNTPKTYIAVRPINLLESPAHM